MWDTKAVNKSNGMPDQMCSTFAKITKLSQEERFMCLLLVQSFPRYFLSIPPKLNPAQTAAVSVSTQHWPNALQSHWQLPVAWHETPLEGTSRSFLPQSSSAPGHVPRDADVPPHGTAGSEGSRLTCRFQWTQAPEPGWQLLPRKLAICTPTVNCCMGESLHHFSSHEKDLGQPASARVSDGKPLQTSSRGTCETTGISAPLLNRLHSSR